MKGVYPVIFTETGDKKDTVLVEVPDWDILTEGFGMADAIAMARDAIGQKGICYEDENKTFPTPTPIQQINAASGTFSEDGKSYASFIDVDFTEYRRKIDNKSVRRNVTLPNWLNREAEKAGINVSKVLQTALIETLGI